MARTQVITTVNKKHGGKRAGAGRPVSNVEPTRTWTVRVPDSLAGAVDAEADRQGLTRTDVVRAALRALVKMPPE
jgi:hypothetical protein